VRDTAYERIFRFSQAASTSTYAFDQVFGQGSNTREVYNNVAQPVLGSVLKGANSTIFAYGATGSGKTHTMQGDLAHTMGPNTGVMICTINDLFRRLRANASDREECGEGYDWEVPLRSDFCIEPPRDLIFVLFAAALLGC